MKGITDEADRMVYRDLDRKRGGAGHRRVCDPHCVVVI